jgi:hypothetical protein
VGGFGSPSTSSADRAGEKEAEKELPLQPPPADASRRKRKQWRQKQLSALGILLRPAGAAADGTPADPPLPVPGPNGAP